MFEKLAKFRPFAPRPMTPWTIPYANDNVPGFRRPEGRRRRPTPAPACHWILIDGHLECRWTLEDTSGDLDRRWRAGSPSCPHATAARAASKLRLPA
ncbi:hypothetical protein [Bradyrhizobium sp. ORS 111]|uniref:hypothetical protein n=1 Tax=Bradyrhizobium sp. ORS 111 TaxID=1685958 RepID=UPI003890FFC5